MVSETVRAKIPAMRSDLTRTPPHISKIQHLGDQDVEAGESRRVSLLHAGSHMPCFIVPCPVSSSPPPPVTHGTGSSMGSSCDLGCDSCEWTSLPSEWHA